MFLLDFSTRNNLCQGGELKMDRKFLSEDAAEKRREYKRQWNAKNRDRVREHTRRYWERKALQEMQVTAENDKNEV